jgi:hypothetical protein
VTFSSFRVFCISNQLYFQPPHKAVILSEALRRSIANRELYGAESKDPEDAYLTHAARSFSSTEARTWRTRHGLFPTHHKNVILSGARHRFVA